MKKGFILYAILLLVQSFCLAQGQSKKNTVYGNNNRNGKYLLVGNIKLYYEIYGKGEPLLLIHGNGGSIKDFKYQIPYFSKYYKVIAVDSRAQGKSVDTSARLNYEMMADDFNALLTNLNIDSANVIGWSDGGINGLLLAIRHPEKVKKLAITGANLIPDTAVLNPAAVKLTTDELVILRTEKQTPETRNTIKLLHMMEIEPNIPLTDLQKIKCPVLVIGGDFDAIKPSHTLQIFENIPRANLWILPASGHATLQRYKNEFNQKVRHFFTHSYLKPKWNDWD
ncbi:MAG: alpha/beta hydrolase [Chitinophagaceae bacterium]|nr:alpha/beta hydrolase [Chitinophagaceae bacterium]